MCKNDNPDYLSLFLKHYNGFYSNQLSSKDYSTYFVNIRKYYSLYLIADKNVKFWSDDWYLIILINR